jgi:hypothetical protein
MPAATTISINDANPTAHVYVPVTSEGGLSIYRNVADATISAAEEQIGLSLSRASSARTTDKAKFTLSVPHEQTVDGAVVVRDVARADVTVTLPNTMTSGERADFAALLQNLLADSVVEDYITDLIPTW